ncbi:HYR-like domain-containing protein, partial [Flavobacterium piscinae]
LPMDMTVECDAVPMAMTLTATDNCGSASVEYGEIRNDGNCPSNYTLVRTWTAMDECGNTTVHTQTITVQDTSAPAFVEELPMDMTVECDAVPMAMTLTATDNCGSAEVSYKETRTDGNCPSNYTLVRVWTAEDECGNTTVHTQTITVQDTTAPAFVEDLPMDMTVECDAVPMAMTLTATDNCGSASVEYGEVRNDGNCPSNYTLVRTWTAMDECGNTTVHSQTITVQDTTAPAFVEDLPMDMTVECDAVPMAMTLTATDNCGSAEVSYKETRTDGNCPSNYTLVRVWTAEDECGNTTVHKQTITVQDTTAPAFVEDLPMDMTVECDAVPMAMTLTATDNCGSAEVSYKETRTDGNCPSNYTLVRVWTAEDECGNTTVHKQTITVQDTTAPAFVEDLPMDMTVECDAVPMAMTLTATDNCGSAEVSYKETRTDGNCPSNYTLVRTWTAMDECGNTTVHTQTITVQDTSAPAFVEELPMDMTVECDAVPMAMTLTATDNCGSASVEYGEIRNDGNCPSNYTLVRTWTAMDECGNTTVHTQTITVQDTTAPAFVEELPMDMTVECDAVPMAMTLTATDNCGSA